MIRARLYAIAFALFAYSFMLARIGTAAFASAPQTAPDLAHARGCSIILPDPTPGDPNQSAALQVRTTRPLSECDGSAPVSFGASVLDGYTGRAR